MTNGDARSAIRGQTIDGGNERCPLCGADGASLFHRDARREYFRCSVCSLVFVPGRGQVSAADEKRHYDQHENDPADLRYRAFLSRLSAPLVPRLRPGDSGLDFGCGPGPTLSVMLAEVGFSMALYDPIYAPDPAVFSATYDFITASEVIEHFREPGFELERLRQLIRPGGWLALMTKRVLNAEAFAKWHYITDPTHVSFFSDETFRWIAGQWNAKLELVGPDVALLQMPAAAR